LRTYEALLQGTSPSKKKESLLFKSSSSNVGSQNCIFCLKVFQTSDFLHAHYKKRHAEAYAREGGALLGSHNQLQQENISLLSNLLHANHGQDSADIEEQQEEFVMKLKEEVVDKFAGDLQHIQAEIEQMRRATFEEEDMIIKTLDNVRSKEDDRIQESRKAVKQFEQLISQLKRDIAQEVAHNRSAIV